MLGAQAPPPMCCSPQDCPAPLLANKGTREPSALACEGSGVPHYLGTPSEGGGMATEEAEAVFWAGSESAIWLLWDSPRDRMEKLGAALAGAST